MSKFSACGGLTVTRCMVKFIEVYQAYVPFFITFSEMTQFYIVVKQNAHYLHPGVKTTHFWISELKTNSFLNPNLNYCLSKLYLKNTNVLARSVRVVSVLYIEVMFYGRTSAQEQTRAEWYQPVPRGRTGGQPQLIKDPGTFIREEGATCGDIATYFNNY